MGRRIVCQGAHFISDVFWDDPTRSTAVAFTPHGQTPWQTPWAEPMEVPLGRPPMEASSIPAARPRPPVTSRRQISREPPAGAGARGSGAPRVGGLEGGRRPPQAPPTSSGEPMGASAEPSPHWPAAWHANEARRHFLRQIERHFLFLAAEEERAEAVRGARAVRGAGRGPSGGGLVGRARRSRTRSSSRSRSRTGRRRSSSRGAGRRGRRCAGRAGGGGCGAGPRPGPARPGRR